MTPDWVIPIRGRQGWGISVAGREVYQRRAAELEQSDDPEDDTDQFAKQFERTGRKWGCVPEWLNATHGGSYHADTRFLQVTKEHRKLALDWLRSEPSVNGKAVTK